MPASACTALLALAAFLTATLAQTSGGSDGRKMQEGCVMADGALLGGHFWGRGRAGWRWGGAQWPNPLPAT
jgi:hypothetical protein